MPQLDQLSACPGCGEPLEDDDRFCGVCGTDLHTAARRGGPATPTAAEPVEPVGRVGRVGRVDQEAPAATSTPTEHDFTLPPPLPAHAPDAPLQPTPAQAFPPPPTAAPRVAAPDPRAAQAAAPRTGEPGGHPQPDDRDHVERALSGVAAVSDLGLRHHRNEDAFTVSATALSDGSPAVIAMVCDGVSSSSRPHEASAAAAEAALEFLLTALPRGRGGREAMHDALVTAAGAVSSLADDAEREPGRNAPACTIVGAIAVGGTLTIGWIGDSRAYWVPEEEGAAPARLTEDDSWAAQMVAAGLLSEAEAMADHRAHAITAWLGADAQEIEPHTRSFEPDRPGVVIVCTDGLWNYAESAEEMARMLPGKARSAPLPSAQHLVRHALDSGGHDNVTVAVIPFPAEPARVETV